MMALPGSSSKARIGAELLLLWEKGVPLRGAPFHFGHPATVRRYHAVTPKGGILGSLINMIADTTGHPEAVHADIRSSPGERQEYMDLSQKIYDSFRSRVLAGEFLILGFAAPRHPSDFPFHVPKALWHLGSLNIDGEKAKGQGLLFEAIRVLPAGLHKAVETAKASPGRPSNRALIQHAYEACVAASMIDFRAPKIRAIEQIRAWLKSHRPNDFKDGRGFAEEAIRKVISADFATRPRKL